VIQLALDRDHVRTGEFVTGSVTWNADDARRAHRITVRAEWETRGHGNDVYCAVRELEWSLTPRDVEKATWKL
jgi:hypothetical protein